MSNNQILEDAKRLVALLAEKGWKISFAESCTGGMVCSRLVDVPNASQVLEQSYVTYSNEAKHSLLGVQTQVLADWGAVSEPVAGQMARGAAEKSGAQVAAAVSGIAGPGGGTPEKPVGTVCFGFYINGRLRTCTRRFGAPGRRQVRLRSTDFVFTQLLQLLQES